MSISRTLALCLSVGVVTQAAMGAVLHNHPQTLVQPDGSVITCYASGDEFHHWLHDAQNFTIVQDSRTGYFVYAVLEKGVLSPTACVVGKGDPRTAGLNPGANLPAAAVQAGREH